MTQLIKINKQLIGTENTNSVNSRELYTTLDSKQDYSTWIKKQIDTLGLDENIDYILLHKKGEQASHGGHNAKDYIITTDTAKHIAMASRTTKGKEIRRYFIEVEKKQNISSTQFDKVVQTLGDKANEADKYKEQYYRQLEANNVLLVEKMNHMTHCFQVQEKEIKAKRRGFTADELDSVQDLHQKGYSYADIGKKIDRNPESIRTKLRQLGVSK